MTRTNKLIYFLISSIFFVVFDMFFSEIILKNIEKFPENNFLDLVFVQNTGAAFSMLENARWFLILFAITAILWLGIYAYKNIEKYSTFSSFWVSMLIAGIFCNLYERIQYGYVRDFFKLNFVNFPVFNISDIFINISVLAVVVIIIKHNFSKNNETGNR